MNLWNIRTRRKLDAEIRLVCEFHIVLIEPFAHVAGRDSNNRIVARIVRGRSAEQLNSQHPLFQIVEVTVQSARDNELQKLLAPAAALERRAFGDRPEVGSQRDRMRRHLKHAGHRSNLFDVIRSTRHGETVLHSKAYHSPKSELRGATASTAYRGADWSNLLVGQIGQICDGLVNPPSGFWPQVNNRLQPARERYSASPSAITVEPATIPISSFPSNW